MKLNLYTLAFLTLWTQVDDQLVAPLAQVIPAAFAHDPDDEFLPVEWPASQKQVTELPASERFGAKPPAMSTSFAGRIAPSERVPTTLISTPLYLFMSLQI